MSEPSVEVRHDHGGSRFCVTMEGYEACVMYRRTGNDLDLYHTYVPEVFRGQGIAEKLCKAAFEYAKTGALRVIPSCSYISGAYLKRHPEYLPLTKSGPTSNPVVSG
ncbi:MAG: N-acetyltransferase [Candidatus Omnitrophica bacterium]|nr:N-acetyltransferase [Candidatus Omnitrophota bacterium]